MMRVLMTAIVLVGLCSYGCSRARVAPQAVIPFVPEPAPQADELTRDFGSVSAGAVVTHEFRLTNRTERTMTIRSVIPSCGCTVSQTDKTVLGPGESARISVSFNSKGYKGRVDQFVYVNTDDPQQEVIRLTIRAFVQP